MGGTNSVELDVTAEPFGAKADGETDNAPAIQKAIDEASEKKATVTIPAAEKPYACGPLKLKSGVKLNISEGAVLQMLPYGTYPKDNPVFIDATGQSNISIVGGGVLEGLGQPWWAAFDKDGIDRPKAMLLFNKSSEVEISGITMRNPPNVHVSMKGCNDFRFTNFTVDTPEQAHNTDGIDICCTKCILENCSFRCGDDNLALGSGGGVTSDVTIKNCKFGWGHGLSIGSHTSGKVHNILVEDCTFDGTHQGLNLKSDRSSGGLCDQVTYQNITLKNVDVPIRICSYYPKVPKAGEEKVEAVGKMTPFWKDITFKNITATYDDHSDEGKASKACATFVHALPEAPAENVTFDNVNIQCHVPAHFAHVKNLKVCNKTTIPGMDKEHQNVFDVA